LLINKLTQYVLQSRKPFMTSTDH